MSKNPGKKFEEDFINSAPANVFSYRLRDSVGYRGVSNICDFILYSHPNLYLLELKSIKGKSLPFTNIAEHQIRGLLGAQEVVGIAAGVVINMRAVNETYFIPINKLAKYIKEQVEAFESSAGKEGRKSVPLSYLRDEGQHIPQELIRTRYRYDLAPLLETGGGCCQ